MARGINCASCGATEGVERHHLYLRADGCPDDLTVPLCNVCHGRAHGLASRVNISTATKAALEAARARGVTLGGYRGGPTPERAVALARASRGRDSLHRAADEFAAGLAETLAELRGLSLRQIAAELTRRGIVTPRGGAWTATAVRRALARI